MVKWQKKITRAPNNKIENQNILCYNRNAAKEAVIGSIEHVCYFFIYATKLHEKINITHKLYFFLYLCVFKIFSWLMYKRFFKRPADIFFSFGGLLITSPVILPLLLFVCLKTKENPFFLQKRPGLHEKLFTLIKMRTMKSIYNPEGNLLPDRDRQTRWGKVIRDLSIDEVPQLINVLKGDMSLIGPRPLLPEYLPLYSGHQRKRHSVRPGITGWAQINGRNSISWQQKFDLDVWYVDHLTFKTDMQIFFQTIRKVLKKEAINRSTEVTMPKFDGTN